VLDVYHALEHVSDTVKAIWGDGTDATTTYTDSGRQALVAEGKARFDRWLATLFATVPEGVSNEPLVDAPGLRGAVGRRQEHRQRIGGRGGEAVGHPLHVPCHIALRGAGDGGGGTVPDDFEQAVGIAELKALAARRSSNTPTGVRR
jgi:hypothetical protein